EHTRYFLYDASHRLIERIDNGVVTDFVHVAGRTIARVEGGTATYILGDYQNTPLFETSVAGAITRVPNYLAYGHPVDAEGHAETPGYTGATADKATGLLYLGARYLHDERFLAIDPVGLDPTHPSGLNRYAYASNNPTRYTDPDGRQAFPIIPSNAAEAKVWQAAAVRSQANQLNENEGVSVANVGSSVGAWITERTSLVAEAGVAWGPGASASAEKNVGSGPDAVSAEFVVGEGAFVGAGIEFRVATWGRDSSGGAAQGKLSVDPGSYVDVKLGAGLALGFKADSSPDGGSFSVYVGGAIGEKVIVKPPINAQIEHGFQ
ncbi:MAG TPA: RHS repeat-associated core domain-containing protein, partial [Rhodanobacteraceae bacterium]|nr:RHS repeat-associated core domain-containing protein [Rhodanobacteraceae bacterium]